MSRFPSAACFVERQRQIHEFRSVDRAQWLLARYTYQQIKAHNNQALTFGYLHRSILRDPLIAPYLPRRGLYPILSKPVFRKYFAIHEGECEVGTADLNSPASTAATTATPTSEFAQPCLDYRLPRMIESINLEPFRWVTLTGTPLGPQVVRELEARNRYSAPMPYLTSDPYEIALKVRAEAEFPPPDPSTTEPPGPTWSVMDPNQAPLSSDPLSLGTLTSLSVSQELLIDRQLLLRGFALGPSPALLEKVNTSIIHLRESFENGENPKDYRVELVGSFATGLAHPGSDINILLYIPHDKVLRLNSTNHHIMNSLKKYVSKFRGGGLKQIRFIPAQSLPGQGLILGNYGKYESYTPVAIRIDHPLPLFETRLLKAYYDFDPRVRPMLQFILDWARQRQLIFPKEHTGSIFEMPKKLFSSIQLAMMLVGFLQYKGVLPVLQRVDTCIHEDTFRHRAVQHAMRSLQNQLLAAMHQRETEIQLPAKEAAGKDKSTDAQPALNLLSKADLASIVTDPDAQRLLNDLHHCLSCQTTLPRVPLAKEEGYFMTRPTASWQTHELDIERRAQKLFDTQRAIFEANQERIIEEEKMTYHSRVRARPHTFIRAPIRRRLWRPNWLYPQLIDDNGFSQPYMAWVPPSFADRCGLTLQVNETTYIYREQDRNPGEYLDDSPAVKHMNLAPRPQAFTYRLDPEFPRNRRNTSPGTGATMTHLLTEFFRFFGHEFPYTQAMVSVRLGGILPRCLSPSPLINANVPGDMASFESQYALLAIEHPFMPESNMVRAREPWSVEGLAWEFRRAYDILKQAGDQSTTGGSDGQSRYVHFDAATLLDRVATPYSVFYYSPQFLRAYRLSGRFWARFHPQYLATVPETNEAKRLAQEGNYTDGSVDAKPIYEPKPVDRLTPEEIGIINDEPVEEGVVELTEEEAEEIRKLMERPPSDLKNDDWRMGAQFRTPDPASELCVNPREHYYPTLPTPFVNPAQEEGEWDGEEDGDDHNTEEEVAGNRHAEIAPEGNGAEGEEPMQSFLVPATVYMPGVQSTIDILMAEEDELLAYELSADEIFLKVAQTIGEPLECLTDEEKERLAANPELDPRVPADHPWAPREWPDPEGEKAFWAVQGRPVFDENRLVRAPYREFTKSGKVVARS
ncbi:hypothetical protein BJ085DRAFT_38719 [Dimargaris cristalligena]|uniref:Uncharacterized protein n=1 Tax=Dimargaris cristalligena TaxID=215637 RepID=A0A4V1J4W2_9FUNG|nr:hypothetical protein BJ085DRAFT_38719 [Dimargaris cristalligena]|eukprot:RKP36949.1 hypothetical protein BJ085DRAFT_38719 [Dimargaris cristalligena]